MDKPELIALAVQTARKHLLDPQLVCAIVEQESNWDPWAVRYEPAFDRRYLLPLHLRPTDEVLGAMSWGLMQVMGETASEHGFQGRPTRMLDPGIGLDIGCTVFRSDLARAHEMVADALQRWNGGANPAYAAQVAARLANYAEAVK